MAAFLPAEGRPAAGGGRVASLTWDSFFRWSLREVVALTAPSGNGYFRPDQ